MPRTSTAAAPADLPSAIAKLDKEFGKGTVMRLGDSAIEPVEVIPSGSIRLDQALGVGGYPRGRVIEIYGPESSGKTTLALQAIASAQHLGLGAAFIDAEHAIDPEYAAEIGVQTDQLYINQPATAEEALEVCDTLVKTGEFGIIVVDSVAALVPRAELEGDMGDSHMGLQARLMSQALRKLTGVVADSNTAVIFINQLREKIGVMFGPSETTTGGKALKFYSSVRLDVRIIERLKDGEAATGNKLRVKVVKNKCAPPLRSAEFDLVYGSGINSEAELLDMAVDAGVVKKSGVWLAYDGQNIGQGRPKAVQALAADPDLRDRIRQALDAEL